MRRPSETARLMLIGTSRDAVDRCIALGVHAQRALILDGTESFGQFFSLTMRCEVGYDGQITGSSHELRIWI